MRQSKELLQYLSDKLDVLDSRMDEMNETLVKQHASLAEHIYRTELLETQMKPVTKHVHMMQGIGAFLMILSLLATIYAAVK